MLNGHNQANHSNEAQNAPTPTEQPLTQPETPFFDTARTRLDDFVGQTSGAFKSAAGRLRMRLKQGIAASAMARAAFGKDVDEPEVTGP